MYHPSAKSFFVATAALKASSAFALSPSWTRDMPRLKCAEVKSGRSATHFSKEPCASEKSFARYCSLPRA